MTPKTIQLAGVPCPLYPIALGTAEYGSQISQDDAFRLLDAYVDGGGNVLDTAHVYGAWDRNGVNGGYGNSEAVLGRWLESRGCRDQMVIGTKGGHPDFATCETGLTRLTVQRQLRECLDRLKTEAVDIYWFHRDNREIPAIEILDWLREPLRAGQIRSIGCSHWRPDRLQEAQDAAAKLGMPPIQTSQIRWCLALPNHTTANGKFGEQLLMDDDTWRYHVKTGLAVIAYNAQAGGLFAQECAAIALSDPTFPKPDLARSFGNPTTESRRQAARTTAAALGCSINQVALAWLLHQPFPTVALVGPKTVDQVHDSLRAAHVSLDENQFAALSARVEREVTVGASS
ncbi:MAG: aldo/keto reductase [Phycisphaeraceae bacterium]